MKKIFKHSLAICTSALLAVSAMPLFASAVSGSKGDVNLDNKFTASDATLILKACANKAAGLESGLTSAQEQNADVNGDSSVTTIDASLVLFNIASEAAGTTYSTWSEVTTAMIKAAEEQKAREEAANQNATLDSMHNQVIALVNEQRTAAGLSIVTTNATITAAADKRAQEIVTSFAHTRPNGTSCFTVFDDYSIAWTSVGENIAMGQPTASSVMNAWMNSAGHRANILNSNYEYIGVGVYQSGGTYYWVQLFYAD